jgi:hypothetical protein
MQVVFTADPNIIGKIIRWFTKISWVGQGRVSHSALRYGRSEDNWMVESNERGFLPNWWPFFIRKRHVYAKYEVMGIEEDLLEKIVDEQIDKFIHSRYDYGNLYGFAIVIFWYRLTKKKIKNVFCWPGHFACSEIIYRIFAEVKKQTGIDYMGSHDPEEVFPEELLMECEKKPELFKKIDAVV